MREVMISVQPKWCELIANGKKTVEVRKTKPKCDVPFKVYIYCTNNGGTLHMAYDGLHYHKSYFGRNDGSCINGKVIGEFVCDAVEHYTSNCTVFESVLLPSPSELEEMCLTLDEFNGYGTRGKLLYGWHISDLVIYDKPRELGEFYTRCYSGCKNCKYESWDYDLGGGKDIICIVSNKKPIARPPQSWCYAKGGEE